MKKCFALLLALCLMFNCAALAEEAPETVYTGMVDENGAPCGAVSWTDDNGAMHFGVQTSDGFLGDEYVIKLGEDNGIEAFHIYTHDDNGYLSNAISYFAQGEAIYSVYETIETENLVSYIFRHQLYFDKDGEVFLRNYSDGTLTESYALPATLLPGMKNLSNFKMEVRNTEEYVCYRVWDTSADTWITQVFVYDNGNWFTLSPTNVMLSYLADGNYYRIGTADHESLSYPGIYTDGYADGTTKTVTP